MVLNRKQMTMFGVRYVCLSLESWLYPNESPKGLQYGHEESFFAKLETIRQTYIDQIATELVIGHSYHS